MKITAAWTPYSSQKLKDMEKYINRIKQIAISRSRALWKKTLKRKDQIYKSAQERGYKDGIKKTSELISLLEVVKIELEESTKKSAYNLLVEALKPILSDALPLSDLLKSKIQSIISQFGLKTTVTVISKTPLLMPTCCNYIQDDSLQFGEVILRHSKGEIKYSLSQDILSKIIGVKANDL